MTDQKISELPDFAGVIQPNDGFALEDASGVVTSRATGGTIGLTRFANTAEATANTVVEIGNTFWVEDGFNGSAERFRVVAGGTYTANADTVIDLTTSGLQAVSYRKLFTDQTQLLADTRPASYFVADPATDAEDVGFFTLGGVFFKMALSGATDQTETTAGGVKLYLDVGERRNKTTAEHAAYDGEEGELTVDTDKKTVVVQDGVKAGGYPLAHEDPAAASGTVRDGTTDDSAALSAHLTSVQNEWREQYAIDSSLTLGDRGRLVGKSLVGDIPSLYAITVAQDAENVLVAYGDASNDVGGGFLANTSGITNLRLIGQVIDSKTYAVLLQGAEDLSGFISVGNFLTTANADAHEWNFPSVDGKYMISAADITVGGPNGTANTAGFCWGNAGGKFYAIVGGVGKEARVQGIHLEEAQRGGVIAGVTIDGCEEDGLYVIGSLRMGLSSVVGTFVAGETITGSPSGATAKITNVGNNKLSYSLTSTTRFTDADSITGGTSGATADIDTIGQSDGDPVVGSALHFTHTGGSSNASALRTQVQTDTPGLEGCSFSSVSARGFPRLIHVGAHTTMYANGVTGVDGEVGVHSDSGGTQIGDVLMDEADNLFSLTNECRAGRVFCNTKPKTGIVLFNGNINSPGFEVDGWRFPLEFSHTGSGAETFKLWDNPGSVKAEGTVTVTAIGTNFRAVFDVYIDGTTLTVNKTMQQSSTAWSAFNLSIVSNELLFGVTRASADDASVRVEFKGNYYARESVGV